MAITAAQPRANARKTTNGFWWADYQAKDAAAAMEFYSRVLGWSFTPNEDPSGTVVYNTAWLGERKIVGLGQMMEQQLASGMPSMWTNYVFVEDAQATAARAEELGGTIAMAPMDIFGEGWMAVILDPTGAAFGLWQPGRHTGADAVNQPSTYSWLELYTTDIDRASEFYGELFGWTTSRMEGTPDDTDYRLFELDGRQFAGLMAKPEDMASAPSFWATWFGVEDVAAVKTEVEAGGGTVLFGPDPMGPGLCMGTLDPQGAFVAFIQYHEWPAE